MPKRLLHLVGSPVDDFHVELSRLYARGCLDATADAAMHHIDLAYVTPDGHWRFPADLSDAAIACARPMRVADAITWIASLRIDVMVPHMFCQPGMTSYRALFDVLDIPYLGNTPSVMALTSDKARTKAIVAAAGVAVPHGELLRLGARPSIKPPAIVKPVSSDNSVGVSLVRDEAEYGAALAACFAVTDEALAETYIELGREVRCGVIVQGGHLVCLPLEEYNVDSTHQPIRTYDDKLGPDPSGDLHLVAKDITRAWIVDPADPVTQRVWDVAKKCHVALGCRHYSLFDFRVDPQGQPWFLEAGLYCSFGRQSVISTMAHAAGIPVTTLFDQALSELDG